MLPTLRPNPGFSAGPARVLQFGDGVFIRAFIGHLLQSLQEQGVFQGSILPIKARSGSASPAYHDQGGWFTVLERGLKAGKQVELAHLIKLYLQPIQPDAEPEQYLETATWSELRWIVSNTTEAGLSLGEKDSFEEACHGSFPAKLTRWLYTRYSTFQGAQEACVQVLPLELLPDNGTLLKSLCLQLAEQWQLPPAFADWLHACRFYNTLVDRIVSGFPAKDYEAICKSLGYEDRLLVVAEPFFSWVIEVSPSDRSLDWLTQSDKKVVLTDALLPYRECKLRLLNAPHTAMVSLGLLAGLETVRECMIHPILGTMLRQLMKEELLALPTLPRSYAHSFMDDVLDRFANPFLHHKLESIALNSTTKIKSRLLPVLHAFADREEVKPIRLYQSLAAWLYLLVSGQYQEHMADDSHRADLQEYRIAWHAEAALNYPEQVKTFFSDILETDLAEKHINSIAQELEDLEELGFEQWLSDKL
jgi:tagaturonate reductase